MSKKKKNKKKTRAAVLARYPVLIGICADGDVHLHGLTEVAYFIRDYGFADDVQIFTREGEFLLDTCCGKIGRCADPDYAVYLNGAIAGMNSMKM
ncbi:MAG: hypothetical protein NC253_15490 [Ruminococcus sp.]|nr:hypothetical protein [Ruminococcus sp.]MCM1382425.1 hypothetical protein [Muribaculaceae bacterium]